MLACPLPIALTLLVLAHAHTPPYSPPPRPRRSTSCQGITNNPAYQFRCVTESSSWESRQRTFVDGTYAVEPICGCSQPPLRTSTDPDYIAPVRMIKKTTGGLCLLESLGRQYRGACDSANYRSALAVSRVCLQLR